uniref:Uncharacterized protein n=1 Tax=Panagrolaimus superbus TaxID=310955 RepID=A0A914YBV0_9BILA
MIRQTEKYTEMPLDNRGGGQVTQTYRVDSFESGRLPNGRLPGGILKTRPYDYSNTNSSNSMSISGPNSLNSVRQPFIPQSPFPTVSQNNYPPKYDANGYNLSPGGGMGENNQRRTNKKANLMSNLCFYGVEGIILLAIVINLILGCVWVYGSRWRVHFEEGMYEEHFCDWTLYWFSWWSVTMHLATFGLLIVAVIFILIYGSMS